MSKEATEESDGQFVFPHVETMERMLHCDETSDNQDLHLVVYVDPETSEERVSILGSNYRHVIGKRILLSLPIAILNLATLRKLEDSGKIPLPEGDVALAAIRQCLEQGKNALLEGHSASSRPHQATLRLDDHGSLFQSNRLANSTE